MCVPACHEKIVRSLNRRSFLKSAALTTAAIAVPACAAPKPKVAAGVQTLNFSRIVDLTHTLGEHFPTYFGPQQLEIESLFSADKDGFNLKQWKINEHTGTHIDSPFHFAGEYTADKIPIDNLFGALAVVDIRQKAEGDADAQLTPDDIMAWESTNGPLPDGAIVAMNSGWEAHLAGDKFRNADDKGVMHFPGFHIETADLLMNERKVKGIMVDTLSLDFGKSPDFAFHFKWLPSNRWGVECAANLSELPASGATVFVGGPKIEDATGGPSRIIAFV